MRRRAPSHLGCNATAGACGSPATGTNVRSKRELSDLQGGTVPVPLEPPIALKLRVLLKRRCPRAQRASSHYQIVQIHVLTIVLGIYFK